MTTNTQTLGRSVWSMALIIILVILLLAMVYLAY